MQPFWSAFEAATGLDATARFYEAFHFDDNERSANALALLVLEGTKRATAGLLWAFEAESKALPAPGQLSVVTDWDGLPLCIIETRLVEVVPYDEVSEAFAWIEGEGDRTLRSWRENHWAYFGRECERLRKALDVRMPVVCEQFEAIYPLAGTSR